MSLNESIQRAENVLIESLLEQQEGVDDRTGKGTSAEMLIEERLIRPHLPAPFTCQKGSVVAAATPNEQSGAIDRVVYDPTIASPLVYGAAHSIFPIEAVAGLIEITMRLNAAKLREDVQRIAPIQGQRRRRHIVPVEDSVTQARRASEGEVGSRLREPQREFLQVADRRTAKVHIPVVHASLCVAGVPDRTPTCGACRHASPEIDRSDSSPRVSNARSVIVESALSVHAAIAGGGMRHYSRRIRQITSAERFPAGVAGRRHGRHARDAQLACWT